MFKKIIIAGLAVLLIGGLLFGRNLVPYATTTIDKVRESMKQSIPIDQQIDMARKKLKQVEPEVRRMRYEIAKETVAIKRLNEQLVVQKSDLERKEAKIMALRSHLDSGDSHYVSKGRAYNNTRVKKELASLFTNYKTCKATINKLEQVVTERQKALEAGREKLELTINQTHELEVAIENLVARQQMLEVQKRASKITEMDNSKLSQARDMVDEIMAKIEVETEMLNLTPDYEGSIPVDTDSSDNTEDIKSQIDNYFDDKVDAEDVVVK